jgi:pyruvate formate lyase activating enzyme
MSSATRTLAMAPNGLQARLVEERFTRNGALHHAAGGGRLRCVACAHRCVIAPGAAGACGVRFNQNGVLRVPFDYVARRYVRAVETNTIFHVLPGARALTFGMFGCDLRCPYCHNHRISQALRDGETAEAPIAISAEQLVDEAVASQARVLCAAYNEPMISAEWVGSVFRTARAKGLRTVIVSDGHSTPEALRYMRPYADVFRVDLKAHDEAAYKRLGGRLQPVLDTIRMARELGYWVEVVTLVVPGLNQDPMALAAMGGQLREISPDIPWHINGFVPRYRLTEVEPASAAFLMLAAGAAYVAGSRYVYVGNAPACAELAHTRCPGCHQVLVRRRDYATTELTLRHGACSACQLPIPGIWASHAQARGSEPQST